MSRLVRVPAESEAFGIMTQKLHLRIDVSCGLARVFRSVPYHDPPVHTHCGDYIWILRLISGFIDLARMVYLLNDVEFYFHNG